MSLLGKILGEGVAAPIDAIGNVFDKLFTSDAEKAAGALALAKMRQHPHILQAEINKIEAAHRSVFVAGWRPYIGWVCGSGLAWAFIGAPLFDWIVRLQGVDIQPPEIPTDMMGEIVVALLGLGALRTFEKVRGRAK